METQVWNHRKGSAPHYQGQVSNEKTGATVATVRDDESGEIGELIASAPALLAALESITEEFANDKADQHMCADPYTLGRITRAREAIAAARGEA